MNCIGLTAAICALLSLLTLGVAQSGNGTRNDTMSGSGSGSGVPGKDLPANCLTALYIIIIAS